VTVTQVVDSRDSAALNNRYLVNQLLADNQAQSEVVVMLTAAEAMTIGLATPSVNIEGLLAASAPTGVPVIANFDPNAPFGQLNDSLILPYGSAAPTLSNVAQIFADPAAIILPGHQGLFVEDLSLFSQDCAFWGANGGSLFTLASEVIALQQVAAVQLAGLQLGANLNAAVAAGLLDGEAQKNNDKQQNEKQNNDDKKQMASEGDDNKDNKSDAKERDD
jgi:hypothetical protein